jgi:CubicO group peptidase (beta-lactamase class C family)
MRLVALTAALACCAPLSAQEPDRVTLADTAAVSAFADELFPPEMNRRHIPGLVFMFVSKPSRRVDPDRTVFRLASVSKTITATAALQLVERGRLDLHKDVNAYLSGFNVPLGTVR